MVIKIHQTGNTENALMYNEKKVQNGVAAFFDSGNTFSADPFRYNVKHRLKLFVDIERNSRVKNKCLHISVNPSEHDYVTLGDDGIRKEIRALLKHLGYEKQPYFVYKHADLERVHFHVVSTRIDKQSGRKIRDSNERRKVQQFIRTLEQKYKLTKENRSRSANLSFSAHSENLKQNLQELFRELNRLKWIQNKKLYDESLARFNVEIRRSGRGYVVCVTDGAGNPIRHPIRLSEFRERPRFYYSAWAEKELQFPKPVVDRFQLAQWARDLNRLVERSKIRESDSRITLKRKSKRKGRRY